MTASTSPIVGVLALQGDFREHVAAFRRLGAETCEVRLPSDLEKVQGLVIPGGESTTMGRLAREYGLEDAVRQRWRTQSLALWGTCAGAIWLAKTIEGRPQQEHLGILEMTVLRNAYGRQIQSFSTALKIPALGEAPFYGTFIRAPRIEILGPGFEILCEHAGTPVMVRQGNCLVTTFHPELEGDLRVHDYFLKMLLGSTQALG